MSNIPSLSASQVVVDLTGDEEDGIANYEEMFHDSTGNVDFPVIVNAIGNVQLNWKCAFCVKASFAYVSFSSSEDFDSHLRRFCHTCLAEFSSEASLRKHYQIKHDNCADTKFENAYFCDSCQGSKSTMDEILVHRFNCDNGTSESTLNFRYRCFACYDALDSGLENVYKHFEGCSFVHKMDASRTNRSVNDIIQDIRQEKHKLQMHTPFRDKSRNLVAPKLPSLGHQLVKNKFLEHDDEFMKVLFRPSRVLLKKIPKIARYKSESKLPKNVASEMGIQDSDGDVEPRRLLYSLPEVSLLEPNNSGQFYFPLYGTSSAGWVVELEKKTAEERKLNPELCLDGAADGSEDDDEEGEELILKTENLESSQEFGVHQTYSSISVAASGLNRIQRPNAPQTPQKCSDCVEEEKWFNTRDALLHHDVFFHGKSYCSPCDIFFDDDDELSRHESMLHFRFTCDICGLSVEGKSNFTKHYFNVHKILHCLFCSYSFTRDNVEAHMTQGHRLHDWNDDSCDKILAEDFLIIFDQTKLTAKCSLCCRKFTRDKIYNHLRFLHHTSTHQAISLLQSANFSVAPDSQTHLSDVVLQEPKSSLRRPIPFFIDFEGRSGFNLIPQSTEYACPIQGCKTPNQRQDAGLHLLTDHSMVFCFICGGFFSDRNSLILHHEISHLNDVKNSCHVCEEVMADQFSLMDHCRDFHGLHFCFFCENVNFDSSSDLMLHVMQYHEMWQDFDGMPDLFYTHLLTNALASVTDGHIDCKMCTSINIQSAEDFRRHLTKFHSVRFLEKFMASFDAEAAIFTMKNLDLTFFLSKPTKRISSSEPSDENSVIDGPTNPKKVKLSDTEVPESVEIDVDVDLFGDESDSAENCVSETNENSEMISCELCPTKTQSKQSMRRHCLRSHDLPPGYFRKDICYSCEHCDALFWTTAEKVQHTAQSHSSIQATLEKCFVCFHISPNKNALRRHFKRMHPDEKLFENVSYKCTHCGELFDMQKKMQLHIREQHPDGTSHPCRLCDKKFTKFSSWKKHQEFHQQESLQHSCPHCGETFEAKKKLTWHLKSCNVDKKESKLNFKCKLCEQKFGDRDEREVHYKQVHPNEPLYPCSECGAKFMTKSARWSHSFTHKAEDTFKCEHCSKTFNRRDTYREHLLIHTGPRYRCTHCPKEFVQRSNLRRHIRIHLGIKPYSCNYCELTFSDKGACNSHMKIHTGDNKVACAFCGQEFSKGQKLRYHMRLHTGEGLLTCNLCQKVFTNSYSLKTHLKSVHAKIRESLPCHICEKEDGFVATSRKSLKAHLDRVHASASRQCRICQIERPTLIDLNCHLSTVHFPERRQASQEEGGYQCRHCEAKFPGLSDIKRHLTEVHEITTGMSMHYLNKYANEESYPDLSGDGDPQTQFSVVLVEAEAPLSAKARKKEEARKRKIEREEQKARNQLLKEQKKLDKEQMLQKPKAKSRKSANPKKLIVDMEFGSFVEEQFQVSFDQDESENISEATNFNSSSASVVPKSPESVMRNFHEVTIKEEPYSEPT